MVKSLVDAAVAEVEKRYGRGTIGRLEGDVADGGERIEIVSSTGSVGLDLAIGIGGWPKGRVCEICGSTGVGRSTLALHAIAETQRAGHVAAYVDMDHDYSVTYASAIGVENAKVLVSQPDTAEQALDIVEVLVRSGAVGLVVVDSLSGLAPRGEIEGEYAGDTGGARARLMSQSLRKLTAIAHRTGTTILFVGGERKTNVHGDASGSNALKFYASVRVELVKRPTGVVAKVVKNKCGAPFREALIAIRDGSGIDFASELLELGRERGLVAVFPDGSYAFEGRVLGRGLEAASAVVTGEVALHMALRASLEGKRRRCACGDGSCMLCDDSGMVTT